MFRQLSDSQEKVLAILPIPSAILSIIGSSIIICASVRHWSAQPSRPTPPAGNNNNNLVQSAASLPPSQQQRRWKQLRKWTPYTRLLVAMSIYDIIGSSTILMANFMRPSDSSSRIWAFGNDSTCSAIGFLNQMSFSSISYNGMLSLYFLLTTRYRFTNERISRCVEPVMHTFSIGYFLVAAIVVLSIDGYGENSSALGCWIKEIPDGCGVSDEPCLSILIAMLIFGIPGSFFFFAVFFNNLLIYLFVWRITKPSKPQQQRRRLFRQSQTISTRNVSTPFALEEEVVGGNNDTMDDVEGTSEDDDDDDETSSFSLSDRDKYEEGRDSEADKQNQRLKLVSSQAFLYVASYAVCHLWTGIMLLEESKTRTPADRLDMMVRLYPIAVIQAAFYPLQGWLNMLVYLRPKYLRYRYDGQDESRFSIVRMAVFGDGHAAAVPNNNNKKKENNSNGDKGNLDDCRGDAPMPYIDDKAAAPKSPQEEKNIVETKTQNFSSSPKENNTRGNQLNGASSLMRLPLDFMVSSLTTSSEDGGLDEDLELEEYKERIWKDSDHSKSSGSSSKKRTTNSNSKKHIKKSSGRHHHQRVRLSQLEAISELSESVFESICSAPEPEIAPSAPLRPISPERSSESRWISECSKRSSDTAPRSIVPLDYFDSPTNDKPLVRLENDGNITGLTPPTVKRLNSLSPPRMPTRSSTVGTRSSAVDGPVCPPTRKLSPPPSPSY